MKNINHAECNGQIQWEKLVRPLKIARFSGTENLAPQKFSVKTGGCS